LCLLAFAAYYQDEAEASSSGTPANDRRRFGTLSLLLASGSQMLYRVFAEADFGQLVDRDESCTG
jgi:hypothetical protein